MTIYFIADVHLQNGNLENHQLFSRFLVDYASKAEAIYILGDFFDSWIGDDYNIPFIEMIKAELIALHDAAIPVFFMPGNRDFLVGQQFAITTYCQLLPDFQVIELQGNRLLLMHGDLLTTMDQNYQRFRCLLRHPITKFLFLHLPHWLRLLIARYLRKSSKHRYQQKAKQNPQIFAIAETAVVKYLRKYQATYLIHGHIHRPGMFQFTLDGNDCNRIVLGPWNKTATILAYTDGKFALVEI